MLIELKSFWRITLGSEMLLEMKIFSVPLMLYWKSASTHWIIAMFVKMETSFSILFVFTSTEISEVTSTVNGRRTNCCTCEHWAKSFSIYGSSDFRDRRVGP